MTVAERIRMLCARLNISQAELARRIGQSPQSFNAKMKRESFNITELEKIAEAAGSKFRYNFTFANGEKI